MPPEAFHGTDMVVRALEDGTPLRGRATRTLHDYWRQKRQARPYPAWRELQLVDLWRVATNLSVKDVVHGGHDFIARYWGTKVAEASGGDATGRSVTAIPGIDSERALVNFRRVAETGVPVLSYRRLSFIRERGHVTFEAVHLPLGPADGPVAQVISAYDFDCDIRDILDGTDAA